MGMLRCVWAERGLEPPGGGWEKKIMKKPEMLGEKRIGYVGRGVLGGGSRRGGGTMWVRQAGRQAAGEERGEKKWG